jgi:NitT/TauT family transport system permease protein
MVTAPSKMVTTLVETLRSDEIGMHLRHTLSAVAIAMSIAIVGGFVIGFILNWVPFLRRAFSPFLAAYYAIPHFAFYPLLIVIFGLGPVPLIVLATLFAMVAMILATMAGLDRVPRVLLKTARIHRLSLMEEIWRGASASGGAAHPVGPQARRRLFLHRCDCRRVHPVDQRHRPRDRLRL